MGKITRLGIGLFIHMYTTLLFPPFHPATVALLERGQSREAHCAVQGTPHFRSHSRREGDQNGVPPALRTALICSAPPE